MVGIELDFIRTEDVLKNPNESTLEFAWKEVGLHVRIRRMAPRIAALGHDPEKHALGPRPEGGYRFSEKIMLKQKHGAIRRKVIALWDGFTVPDPPSADRRGADLIAPSR